jgi:hypothetical protein
MPRARRYELGGQLARSLPVAPLGVAAVDAAPAVYPAIKLTRVPPRQGERMNIFLENKLETAIALNMLSEFAMVDVAIYTIL